MGNKYNPVIQQRGTDQTEHISKIWRRWAYLSLTPLIAAGATLAYNISQSPPSVVIQHYRADESKHKLEQILKQEKESTEQPITLPYDNLVIEIKLDELYKKTLEQRSKILVEYEKSLGDIITKLEKIKTDLSSYRIFKDYKEREDYAKKLVGYSMIATFLSLGASSLWYRIKRRKILKK